MASVETSESIKYLVKIINGVMTSKLPPTLNEYDGYTETTKVIYDSLVSFPYSCDVDADGNLINISELPKEPLPPQPLSEIELLRLEMAQANAELFEMMLMMNGGTV